MAAREEGIGDGIERQAGEAAAEVVSDALVAGDCICTAGASDAPVAKDSACTSGAAARQVADEVEPPVAFAAAAKSSGVAAFLGSALERGRQHGRRLGRGRAPGGPGEAAVGHEPRDLDDDRDSLGGSAKDTAPEVSLPGEPDLSVAGEDRQAIAGPAPLWRRPAIVAVAVLALGGGALGACLLSQGGSSTVGAAAANPGREGMPGPAEVGVVAPAAKLALVPAREPGLEPVPELLRVPAKGDQIAEITSLKQSVRTAVLRPAEAVSAPGGEALAGVGARDGGAGEKQPQEVGVTPQVQREAVGSRAVIAGKYPARVEPEAAGAGRSGGVDSGSLPPLELRGGPNAREPNPAAPGEVTAARRESGAGRGDQFEVAVAKAGGGEPRSSVVEGVARVGGRGPESAVPGPSTEVQDTKALGLVTELGALLAKAQQELTALKADHQRLRMVVEAKLGVLDHRLAFAEAKASVDSARAAAATVAEGPKPVVGASLLGGRVAAETKPVIVPLKAVIGGVEEKAQDPAAVARYRVQAASPGLAMLAEVGRSGGEGAQLQVAIGDLVAGYGKVTNIVQRGTAWIVQTDRGSIQ